MKPYSLEALLLHMHCKYHVSNEGDDSDAWMLIGLASRLAVKMGYHRDPRHFPSIKPFEGEMRRRVFFVVQTFDLLLSFSEGLPSTLQEEECDTEPPRNLLDEDFDEDIELLPPSRPVTERTSMLYFSYKAQFTKMLKQVMKHALSASKPSYEQTMDLDSRIRSAHKDVPPGLKMRSISSLLTDTARMIINRLHIDLVYQKSICVLHRQYLSLERSNPRYDYSRNSCREAAMKILNHHDELYELSGPGRRFENNPWMISSMALPDFLLAAMIICLDLYEGRVRTIARSDRNSPEHTEQYDALVKFHYTLIHRSGFAPSGDRKRAADVLAAMLRKIPPPSTNDLTGGSHVLGTASWLTSTHALAMSNSQQQAAPPQVELDFPSNLSSDSIGNRSGDNANSAPASSMLVDRESLDYGDPPGSSAIDITYENFPNGELAEDLDPLISLFLNSDGTLSDGIYGENVIDWVSNSHFSTYCHGHTRGSASEYANDTTLLSSGNDRSIYLPPTITPLQQVSILYPNLVKSTWSSSEVHSHSFTVMFSQMSLFVMTGHN